jgi:hypothetical protein
MPRSDPAAASVEEREPGVASHPRLSSPARADGLLALAETTLRPPAPIDGAADEASLSQGGLGATPGEPAATPSRWSSDRYRVLIHLSESLLGADEGHEAFLEDGTLLSAEAFRRVSCDGGLVPAVISAVMAGDSPENPGVLDVGRQSRAIPAALRRALWLRDGGCAFPGCANHRFVHGHHIRHWAHGGETALRNLVLLCSFHHRLAHEGGFSLVQDASAGAREWRDRDGRPIAEAPAPLFAADERPSLLALADLGVALPADSETNACGWDGWPVDHAALLDGLIGIDPLFASG